uniref:CMP/dCMP-type deaminase domain-containing protein n=1 Tax=Caenorhabditis japonica TaxID=281687 RepID=A0A8R1HI78_CAEJA
MTQEEPAKKIRKIDFCSEIKVIPILDPKLTANTVPSTSYQAISLDNKKVIGQIIGRLKELPERLQHLKRVGKDGSVLISESREGAEKIIDELGNGEVRVENLKTVQVPSIKPSTRRQFDYAKQLWPTGFHPDHEIERLLDGTFLTSSHREYISSWIQKAIEIGNGSIAVQDSVLLSSASPSAHPLGHSVMEMVGSLPKRSESEYLGTGCDVFLANEPCAMCAMALVHFRVKRVFYACESKNGVLKEASAARFR